MSLNFYLKIILIYLVIEFESVKSFGEYLIVCFIEILLYWWKMETSF